MKRLRSLLEKKEGSGHILTICTNQRDSSTRLRRDFRVFILFSPSYYISLEKIVLSAIIHLVSYSTVLFKSGLLRPFM